MNLEDIADDFWHETGYSRTFPRPIEQALALKLPVTLVKLPDVTVRSVGAWLRENKHSCSFPTYENNLMGCLYAFRGFGYIFICGADPVEEQRFTVSHDAAHFIADYWIPRLQVLQALGSSISEVLDGERPPSIVERASAILARVRLGAHWHLLPRRGREPEDDPYVARAEDRADALGLELVAPKRLVIQMVKTESANGVTEIDAHCHSLAAFFGLPPYIFEFTVKMLVQQKTPTFLEEALRMLRR